jgi:predicted DNA-binding protein
MRRPLNTDKAGRAYRLDARVPDRLRARLEMAASRRGCAVAVVVREALERHLPDLEDTGPPGRAA